MASPLPVPSGLRPVPTIRLDRELPGSAAARPGVLAVALAGVGVTPVTLVAASMFGVDLRSLALAVGLPALVVVAVAVARSRQAAALVRSALAAGLLATALYDVARMGFLWAGVVDRDPIPHIGVELGLDPPVVFGYLWRYLGNGTGLALAFLALGRRGTRAGVAYGLAVGAGLLATLAVSPHGEQLLFPLTPGTIVMATTGHLIFGAVLGRFSVRPVPVTRPGGRAPSPLTALAACRPAREVDEAAPVGLAS
jgi:hypothetical protein